MNADEIRGMSIEDMATELEETREELMRLRFQQATGELVDHNQLRTARRKIARILTVMKQEEQKEGDR